MAERSAADTAASGRTSRDRSPVNWLLLVPVLLVIWPPLFNKISPTLFGFPFFYWYQFAGHRDRRHLHDARLPDDDAPGRPA